MLTLALVTGLLVQVQQASLSLGIILLEGNVVGLSEEIVQKRLILRPGTVSDHIRIEEALRFRSAREASSSQLTAGILRHVQHGEQIVGLLQVLVVVAWDVLRAAGERTIVLVVALEGTVSLHAWLSVALLGQVHQAPLSTLGVVTVFRSRDEVVGEHMLLKCSVFPGAQILEHAQYQTVHLRLIGVSFAHVALETLVRHSQVDSTFGLSLGPTLSHIVMLRRQLLRLDGSNDGYQGNSQHDEEFHFALPCYLLHEWSCTV
uniref:Secreted protein n=1 Tax=Anopheles funestus TaxID=62324 RepID=A0A4Y0BHZ0_ANOFN